MTNMNNLTKTPFLRYPQKEQKIIIALDNGGLGDCIARTPVIPYLLEKYPHLDITYYVPKYFECLAKRMLPKSKKLQIRTFDKAGEDNKFTPVKSFAHSGFYSNLAVHMTDHAFRIITGQEVEPQYKNYLPINLKKSDANINRFNLPEKFVVIPTGYTAKVREMRPEVVNTISEYLLEKGYTPVFLGKRETAASGTNPDVKIIGEFSDEIRFDLGIDLRDKTTLLETVLIIQNAAAICGLDNGLLHVAGCTETPIVGGFTTVDPLHRMPYRNGILGYEFYPVVLDEADLPCNFCQSRNTLTIKHPNKDFRFCIYDDYKCTEMLDAGKYIEKLNEILV